MPPETALRLGPGPAPASRGATRLHVRAVLVAAVVRGARRRLAAGVLLLGGLSLVPAAAAAQGAAPAMGSPTSSLGVHSATDSLEEQAAARVAAAVCDKRVVLLGELPDHGHARGFGVKARIVEHLVTHCGFQAVLFEAGSYGFFGLERAIADTQRAPGGAAGAAAGAGRTDSLELSLARAIGAFWWTRELAGWRRWLLHEAVAGRVAVGGLDDQAAGATATYARATLPGLVGAALPPARSAECQDAVGRHLAWGYTAALPYDSTERARLADCTRLAADRALGAGTSTARAAERRTPDEVMLGDLAGYFARERGNSDGGAAGPDRGLVMAQNLAWWSARLPPDAKIVVWTATVHAARARREPPRAPSLGARLAERWGDQLAAVGFTALRGQWSRAAAPVQPLAPLPPDALEARALAAGADGDAAGWAYLDQAALRSLGPVPSRLFGSVATTDWSSVFDGVLVIRDEAAPTFEPRR